jgi:hypothetical protein
MLDKHIKRDGSTVLVAQLSDDHLNNFINLVLKQVMVAQGAKQEGVTVLISPVRLSPGSILTSRKHICVVSKALANC